MEIKNKKLMEHTGERPANDLPSMYKDSKLFSRKHPNKEDSQYSKAIDLPDPQLEDIEPTGDDKLSKTKKAISLLNSFKGSNPDTTGKLEGKFKVSLNEMIDRLNDLISAEYSEWMRWYHYSLILRGHYRDALAGEFEDHAEEELEHAEKLAMRVVALGGYPTTDMEHPLPLRDNEEIIKELIRKEQEGIQLYRKVIALCGDNEGTRQVLESNLGIEQDHVDELWRYLKNPEMIKANFSAGRNTMPSEKRAKKEYSTSFARYPRGISGVTTPDLPDRGKDWDNEVDEEEEQKEAEATFKDPVNLLNTKNKKSVSKSFTSIALKALAGAPIFATGPLVPPAEKRFLVEQGYSPDEIDSGVVQLTPRLRGEYNRWLTRTVKKSLSSISIGRK